MTHATHRKAGLFLGCAGAAIAIGLAATPQQAAAQAFQATPTVVQGSATIDRATPNLDTITVDTMDTVIDWVPDEISGTALTYLPAGNTAIFQNNISSPDFAVLNRILPSTNGDIVVMDGAVISQLQSAAGPTVTGGNVAFYSPTGILVGSSATFDVGRLILTTIDPDITQLNGFWNGGSPLTFTGVTGDVSRITIQSGAQITATEEGSYFAAVAPGITMSGTANINGTTAYVAGEQVNLTYSGGLFDIVINVGTSVTNAIAHDGSTGGPSSTGTGDNHLIYAVAQAAANPIQMLFTGDLGFQPAAVAGVDNGDIILAANYDVFGRTVDGGTITDGINALFDGDSAKSTTQTDLVVDNVSVTSDLLAIGTDFTQVNGSGGSSSFSGDLLIVGRGQAILNSDVGLTTSVAGDVLITANDYGTTGSGVGGADPNATAGSAFIDPVGGTITIGGNVTITADAVAGTDTDTSIFGTATGGGAQIFATGGTINIAGNSVLTATASQRGGALADGGLKQGGFARIGTQGGSVTLQGDATVSTSAFGGNIVSFVSSSGVDATGGTSTVEVLTGGGVVTIQGALDMQANGVGGIGQAAGPGSIATGGTAIVRTQDVGGQIDLQSVVTLRARAIGGRNQAGVGGTAIGGNAQLATFGGQITAGADVTALADASGGRGTTGGDADAGIAGVFAETGTISITGSASMQAFATGGNGDIGFGGNGGDARGGNAFVQAEGTLTTDASISIGLNVSLVANALGGGGGAGDGSAILAGAGGQANAGIISTPNAADPTFGGGAYLLAQGDRGSLTVGGTSNVSAIAFGGAGGAGGPGQTGGAGGAGFGGTAQAGSFLGTGDGSVGLGVVTFSGAVSVNGTGTGGLGGAHAVTGAISGAGGFGRGGTAAFTARAGTMTATDVSLNASGFGGLGGLGGDGSGGSSGVIGGQGSDTTITSLLASAQGIGGGSNNGAGGDGDGGSATVSVADIGTNFNSGDITIDGGAVGGTGNGGVGGNATGGIAFLDATTGASIAATGSAVVNTVSTAGAGTTGGNATGGGSDVLVSSNGSITADLLDINAGADTAATDGGNITGGSVALDVSDGSVTANQLVLTANADAVGGAATGGSTSIFVQPFPGGSAVVDATQTFMEANANGGATNVAGDFDIEAIDGGQFTTQDLFASADGTDGITDPSALYADNGTISIINTATIDAAGDLAFETANGGFIVGGSSPLDLSATFLINSGATVSILGDNDAIPTFGALAMTIASRDINVPLGARFGAQTLSLISTNESAPALIGGTSPGAGYTLTQDEAERIEASAVSFTAPALGTDPLRAPDVELADLVISGSQDDGPFSVNLSTDGIVGITGLVNYTNAGSSDFFQIFAGEQIQIFTASPSDPVTDLDGFPVSGGGQIYMNNIDGEISGFVTLASPSIIAAEPDTIAQILADPTDPALRSILADPGGRSEATVTIAANAVTLIGEDYIFFQNVGTSSLPSAIAVGEPIVFDPGLPPEGGLTLLQSSDSLPNVMDAIVFALQVNPDGSFTSGSDFFPLATFNMEPANHFTDNASLNGCLIITGVCSISGGPIDEAPPINNPAIVEDPVVGEPTEPSEEEGDSEFGMDFPGLLDTPTVSEDGVIDDPVTSGGDSALYSGGEDDSDDEEEDNNGE